MNYLETIKSKIFGIDPETLIAYRTAIPSTIDLRVDTIGDTFIATIESINKQILPKDEFLITEAHSQEQLVDMVNDLIFSYKNIPIAYRPYYKKILQPQGAVRKTNRLELVKAG